MYPAVGDATTQEVAETGLEGRRAHDLDDGLPTAVVTAAPLPAAPVSNAALTLAKIERADALGISVPLLETLTVCLINRTKSAEIRYDDLVAGAEHTKAIQAALMRLPEQPGAGARDFDTSIGHFVGGRFAECDRALAAIEERSVERTIAPIPDSTVTELALAIRLVRAELTILQGLYQKAARHFGFAQRYVPRSDADTRWPLAEQEAHYYEVAAYQGKAPSHLDQAARACTSAIATLPDEQPTVMMAKAQSVLARLLTIIGERDQAPERFEIAAQLLASAQQTFADNSHPGEEATIAALRAGALTRLGELINKAELLEQAAWIVQSALELALEDRESLLPQVLSDDAGRDLELQLALSVAGFAMRTDRVGLLEKAVDTIEAKLPALLEQPVATDESGYSRNLLAVRCHHAMAAWLGMSGDEQGGKTCLGNVASAYAALGFKDLAETSRSAVSVRPHRRTAADAA